MKARDVQARNKAAERALRPSVIFRKVTNGFRSPWDADVLAAVRSVIGTGRLHGLTAYQSISRSLGGHPIFPAWSTRWSDTCGRWQTSPPLAPEISGMRLPSVQHEAVRVHEKPGSRQ